MCTLGGARRIGREGNRERRGLMGITRVSVGYTLGLKYRGTAGSWLVSPGLEWGVSLVGAGGVLREAR